MRIAKWVLAACLVLAQNLHAESKKVADKEFWTITAVQFGMMVADYEVTQYCLRQRTCAESNPFFGPFPSRKRMYGVGVPVTFSYALVGYLLKRRRSKIWWIPQTFSFLDNSRGFAYGLQFVF